MLSDAFLKWAERLRPVWDKGGSDIPTSMHRKLWEWIFILAALDERGMLRPGVRGLGLGVGRDPITAVLADAGCEVVATDLDPDRAIAKGWQATGQYAGGLASLNEAGLCDPEVFSQRVRFEVVDMNQIPAHLTGFDFTWSACAFEHLGSIALGQEFVLRQVACLRPGGVGLTPPSSMSSPTGRPSRWATRSCSAGGTSSGSPASSAAVVTVSTSTSPWAPSLTDRYVDVPPWGGPHLKLQVADFVSTSLGLIIECGDPPPASALAMLRRATRARLARYDQRAVHLFDRLDAGDALRRLRERA